MFALLLEDWALVFKAGFRVRFYSAAVSEGDRAEGDRSGRGQNRAEAKGEVLRIRRLRDTWH